MPQQFERPEQSEALKKALRNRIMLERRKQKEQEEQHFVLQRQLAEKEEKKKEETMTLEQTREQIKDLERHLEDLKRSKHDLFTELKKVLSQKEETRVIGSVSTSVSKDLQQISSTGLVSPPGAPAATSTPLKRPRSPSPPGGLVARKFPRPMPMPQATTPRMSPSRPIYAPPRIAPTQMQASPIPPLLGPPQHLPLFAGHPGMRHPMQHHPFGAYHSAGKNLGPPPGRYARPY